VARQAPPRAPVRPADYWLLIMLRSYLKLAWKVLWRRRFFTAISLFGISLTLVVLMVATALLDHQFAPMPPETRQARTLVVFGGSLVGPNAMWKDGAGFQLLDRYARNLPNVERMAMVTYPEEVYSYPGGVRVESSLRRSDAEYWRILEFDFVEGGPFTDQDVAIGSRVAVINAATRDRFFGRKAAVGGWIDADGQRFRVVGVTANVSAARPVSSGDIFVPFTTAKTDAYRTRLLGNFMGLLLARGTGDLDGIKAEFAGRVKSIPMPDRDYERLDAPAESYFEKIAGNQYADRSNAGSRAERLRAMIVGAALLFLLLPTVNLVNLNVSRIMERASEIGVRKAFGASTGSLVTQFVVENVMLTLVGGAIGFALSAAVLRAITAAGLIEYANLSLNPRVFLYGLGLALVFGLLSGVYPAWRMARLHPVAALKGASR
jgi:putative ABC transport system permease protein